MTAMTLPLFGVSARHGRGARAVLPLAACGHVDADVDFLADLYVNLNLSPGPADRIYSLRSTSGGDRGLVRAYANAALLVNATFVVHERGRQRVLAERCKHVHAWVRGTVAAVGAAAAQSALAQSGLGSAVGYNPYRTGSFLVLPHGTTRLPADLSELPPVISATAVLALPDALYAFHVA